MRTRSAFFLTDAAVVVALSSRDSFNASLSVQMILALFCGSDEMKSPWYNADRDVDVSLRGRSDGLLAGLDNWPLPRRRTS